MWKWFKERRKNIAFLYLNNSLSSTEASSSENSQIKKIEGKERKRKSKKFWKKKKNISNFDFGRSDFTNKVVIDQ